MPAYLTVDEFRLRTLLPTYVLDEIEQGTPGWLQSQLETFYADVNARLSKRYNVPFADPPPTAVQQWCVHIVSLNAWLKRGVSAVDESFTEYQKKHDRAFEEMREAADAVDGLFDLPATTAPNGGDASGIKRGGPHVYSENSPYVGFSKQARIGRSEDSRGDGTKR